MSTAAATDLYDVGIGIDPSGAVAGGRTAQDTFDKLSASVDRLSNALDKQDSGLKKLPKAHHDAAAAGEEHRLRLGMLERTFISLSSEVTGISSHFEHLGAVFSEYAAGGAAVVAVLGGITALGMAWEALTEETVAAQKAADDYMKSPALQAINELQRRNAGLGASAADTTHEQIGTALKNAFTDNVSGNDMISNSLRSIKELAAALANGSVSAAKFGEEMQGFAAVARQTGSSDLEATWTKINNLGNAFIQSGIAAKQADADYENALTMDPAVVEADVGEMQRLEAEWKKFGEAVKRAHEEQDAFNKRTFESNLETPALLDKMEQTFKSAHEAPKMLSDLFHTDFQNYVKSVMPDDIASYTKGTIDALHAHDKEVADAAARPFRAALQSLTHDLGNWFADVVNGGSNTFKKLADSIRDTFAKLLADLGEMKLAQAILSPDTLKSLGIPAGGTGFLQGHSQLLGGLTIAGTSAAMGYSMGSTMGGAGGIAAGALGGAGTGAMLGSVIPGIGTAVGAVIGGVVGTIGGLFGDAAKRHAEDMAQAAKNEEETQLRSDANIRAMKAQGRAYEAESAQLALDHEKELADARQKGYDAATMSAVAMAQAAEDAALVVDQLARKQKDTANAIVTEGKLFGFSDADTAAQLANLFGFTGLTRDQILAQYTRGGGELTAEQQAKNDAISTYLNSAGAPQAAPSSQTLGGVSQISAAQADVMTGLLGAQVMWLSKIEANTRTMASGGVAAATASPATASTRQLDAAMAASAMNRRAAVGAPRTPSPA